MADTHETAGARATLDDLKRGLARAERHHDACWDATVHLSALCERALELKRELRARVIAGNDLSRALPACTQDPTAGELRSRIRLLDEFAPPAEVQSAFLDLYTAKLMVDGARAELLYQSRRLAPMALARRGIRHTIAIERARGGVDLADVAAELVCLGEQGVVELLLLLLRHRGLAGDLLRRRLAGSGGSNAGPATRRGAGTARPRGAARRRSTRSRTGSRGTSSR